MARQRKALQTLKEKDVPNANMHNIETNSNNEATTNASTDQHVDGSTNEPSGSSEPQDNEPRRSERIVDAAKRAALAAKTQTAAAKAALKAKPPPKAKSQPKKLPAVPKPKERPIKSLPKPKATPKPKPEAKKPVAGPSQSVRRNANKTVPTPEEIASTYETRLLASGLRRLQDVVACFQERLGGLHEGVVKMADTPVNTLPGSIAHENMFQDFRAGLDELEGYFPTVVQELVCSAKTALSLSQKKRYNNTSMGNKRQETAETTRSESLSRKRLRETDTNGAESDGRHHPRRRLVPPVSQDRSSQGDSSPSTSNADPRKVDESESEKDHLKRLGKEKDRKGKGKETVVDSNLEKTSNDPPQDDLLGTEGVSQTTAIETVDSGSTRTTPRHGDGTHQALEDLDGEELIRSDSVIWRTSSCRSDPLPRNSPTQPAAVPSPPPPSTPPVPPPSRDTPYPIAGSS